MRVSTKESGLSLDLRGAIRSNKRHDYDLSVVSELQLRACEDVGARIAQAAQKQLTACGMGRPIDWLKHRALVIGYVCGIAETSKALRSAAARACLSALSALLGPEWDEDALCVEGQRLREQEHPGYIAGLQAAGQDRSSMDAGKTSTALARAIIDREMRCK